jgi:hypothetical protein
MKYPHFPLAGQSPDAPPKAFETERIREQTVGNDGVLQPVHSQENATPASCEPDQHSYFSTIRHVSTAPNRPSKVARLEEETSNALFDELADWNKHLKAEKVNFPRPRP